MGLLGIAAGPACPNCGCKRSTVVSRRAALWPADKEIERRACGHCGREWSLTVDREPEPIAEVEPGAVQYHPHRTACPSCGVIGAPVTSTRGQVRHHKCAACGACFKSGG